MSAPDSPKLDRNLRAGLVWRLRIFFAAHFLCWVGLVQSVWLQETDSAALLYSLYGLAVIVAISLSLRLSWRPRIPRYVGMVLSLFIVGEPIGDGFPDKWYARLGDSCLVIGLFLGLQSVSWAFFPADSPQPASKRRPLLVFGAVLIAMAIAPVVDLNWTSAPPPPEPLSVKLAVAGFFLSTAFLLPVSGAIGGLIASKTWFPRRRLLSRGVRPAAFEIAVPTLVLSLAMFLSILASWQRSYYIGIPAAFVVIVAAQLAAAYSIAQLPPREARASTRGI